MKEKKFTLMEHFETADDLALIYSLIIKIYNRTKKQYPKTHPLSKGLDKFILDYLPMLQNRFDNEFHKSIDDKTWKKLEKEWGGHIYYNLKKRLSK